MMNSISLSFPLSGTELNCAAAAAGLLTGVVLTRSGMNAATSFSAFLAFRERRISQTLLAALLTAMLCFPLFHHFFSSPDALTGQLWQTLLGGVLSGIGAALSGRTFFTALSAPGRGEFHAVWFLAGAAAMFHLAERYDLFPVKVLAKHDFTTRSLCRSTGSNFFSPDNPALWILATAIVLYLLLPLLVRREKN